MRKWLLVVPLLLAGGLFMHGCDNTTGAPDIYTLTTSTTPVGGGTISPSEGEFDEDKVVELVAVPEEGYLFDRWDGDIDGSANPDSLIMDSDKSVTAIFIEKEYELNIEIQGEGHVKEKVVEDPAMVQLTAKPAESWEFIRWEEDLEGDENPVTITIEKKTLVRAVFEKSEEDKEDPPDKNYSITTSTEGEGTIHLDPDKERYGDGEEVAVTAEPDDGWRFARWEGDFSGSENPVTFGIDQDKNIIAVFEEQTDEDPPGNGNGDEDPPDDENGDEDPPAEEFLISASSEGEGTISVDPDKETYEDGEEVTVTAEPDDGWRFARWEGDFSGSENPVTFNIDQDKSITAVFETEEFTVTTSVDGMGDVILDPDNFVYQAGVEATLTAEPDEGWQFARWEGDLSGDENPVTFTINEDKNILAVFEEDIVETISHGFVEGVTPGDDPQFAERTYPVIQANWDGPGGDKRWLGWNLGATDAPESFEDDNLEHAGWFFTFNRMQGYIFDTEETFDPVPDDFREGPQSVEDWEIANDPCREALGGTWRIPNEAEWEAVRDDAGTALDIHLAGVISNNQGVLTPPSAGTIGAYWSSAVMDATVRPNSAVVAYPTDEVPGVIGTVGASFQDYGHTIRCIEG